MYVTSVDKAETRAMRGDRGLSHRLINPQTGCQYVDIHVNVLRPGTGPGPYHYHSNADNIYFVLSGQGCVVVDGVRHEVGPGDAMLLSPQERHGVENIGDEDLRLIEIKVPADSDFILAEDAGTTPKE